MKVSDAIRRADNLRPNAIDNETKAAWLYNLDSELTELMGLVCAPKESYEEEDPDLLMPDPKSEFYVFYVMALIDEINEDTELYQNDMTIANEMQSEARRWWQRTHKTPKQKGVIWY